MHFERRCWDAVHVTARISMIRKQCLERGCRQYRCEETSCQQNNCYTCESSRRRRFLRPQKCAQFWEAWDGLPSSSGADTVLRWIIVSFDIAEPQSPEPDRKSLAACDTHASLAACGKHIAKIACGLATVKPSRWNAYDTKPNSAVRRSISSTAHAKIARIKQKVLLPNILPNRLFPRFFANSTNAQMKPPTPSFQKLFTTV